MEEYKEEKPPIPKHVDYDYNPDFPPLDNENEVDYRNRQHARRVEERREDLRKKVRTKLDEHYKLVEKGLENVSDAEYYTYFIGGWASHELACAREDGEENLPIYIELKKAMFDEQKRSLRKNIDNFKKDIHVSKILAIELKSWRRQLEGLLEYYGVLEDDPLVIEVKDVIDKLQSKAENSGEK